MKTKYTIVVLILALLASSCGSHESKSITDKDPVSVKVNLVNENSNNSFLTASGTIQALKSANLSTRMMGYVTKTPVNVGDIVKKGDLLVKVNPDLIQSALNRSQASYQNVKAGLEQVEATLKQAKADYERSKVLFDFN